MIYLAVATCVLLAVIGGLVERWYGRRYRGDKENEWATLIKFLLFVLAWAGMYYAAPAPSSSGWFDFMPRFYVMMFGWAPALALAEIIYLLAYCGKEFVTGRLGRTE